LAEHFLSLYQPLPVMPSFNLTLMYNQGAAFSFLSDAGGWQRWLFALIAFAVSVALLWWLKRLDRREKRLAIALALILGGALGNLIDRLLLGHVVDFLDVYYADWHWPAFNIADSAISAGAVLMVIDSLFGRPQPDV
jgi:signal peptidase II